MNAVTSIIAKDIAWYDFVYSARF